MKKIAKVLFLFFCLLAGEAMAAVCTSQTSGNWNNAATWSCGHVPLAADTVVIASPNTVVMDIDPTVAGLTVNAGATVDDAGSNLFTTGNVVINGTFGVSPGCCGGGGTITMTGANTTLSGTGSIVDVTVEIDNTGVSIPVGSTLNFSMGGQIDVGANVTPANLAINGTITGAGMTSDKSIIKVQTGAAMTINGAVDAPLAVIDIKQSASVTNNGTANLQYIKGKDATSIWTQGNNSALTVSQTPAGKWQGTFNASATGNTVNYNGTATPLTPSGNTYYNLAGAGVTCPHGFAVLGSDPCASGPLVTSINIASADPTTSGAAVSWTVRFGTSVTGVTAANFALVQAGGVTGAAITSVTGAGTTWTVNANTGSGTGTLGLNMVNVTGISPAITTAMPFVGQVYTVSAPPPPGTQPFDAVEVGAAIGSPIRTKIAGQAFILDVLAVKNGVIDTGYKDTPAVDLIAGAASCVAVTPALTGVTVTPVGYKYTKAGCGGTCDNGRHSYTFTSAEAYANVRVRVQDNKGKIGCSFDNFAIRPGSLANLAVSDTDWISAGTTRALNNTAISGTVMHKAGRPFTVGATAVNAAATPATTANYTGTPTALLTACAGTACTATFGALTLGTATVAGVINSTTATYSEVGSFALQLQDQTFANVDALDSTTAERYFSSAVINVGRFVPDHFDIAVVATATTPMPCPTGLTCPTSYNGIIYSGQPFSIQVTARNLAGGPTTNYDGTLGFSKAVTLTAWDALGSIVTQNPGGGAVANNSVNASDFNAGIATTATPTYTFPAATTAPTDIYMRAVDTDSVSSRRASPATSVEGGVKVVSGRIKIGNAHGSELLPLPISATVQYYSGTYWVTSATDDATSFNTNLSTSGGNLVATIVSGLGGGIAVSSPGIAAVVAGARTFRFSAPGVRGSANISLNAPAYLPSNIARATFGVYKGANEFIYMRENY